MPRGREDSQHFQQDTRDENREETSSDSNEPVVDVKRAQMNELGQPRRRNQQNGERERSRRYHESGPSAQPAQRRGERDAEADE